MSKSDSDEIQEVGDELTDLHAEVNRMIESMANQRKKVHNVADGKKEVEMELKRYLVWMQGALNVDEDEMKLCDGLEEKLELLLVVHADAKKARDERRSKAAKEKDIAEATAKKKAEEEELKRSLEQIQKEKAPKEGMVWNKQVREYQYLADATQESWRD
jgi:tRNA U34 5-carboxymethylaminomethyl modifying GTPase MnmE/TrmE